jgi:hypothetical protein
VREKGIGVREGEMKREGRVRVTGEERGKCEIRTNRKGEECIKRMHHQYHQSLTLPQSLRHSPIDSIRIWPDSTALIHGSNCSA